MAVAFFQSVLGSRIQLQNSQSQDNWSRVVLKEVVSADKVLVTTRWIFLHPQLMGFTGQTWLFPISACVVMIIVPVCYSDCFFEANEAAENARGRVWSMGMGWIRMHVSLYLFASWSILFPWMSVSTVALFTSLWIKLKRLERSGLVFTAAYWGDPIKALKSCLFRSVTGRSSWVLRWGWMRIGLVLEMDFSWDMTIEGHFVDASLSPWRHKIGFFGIQNGTGLPTLWFLHGKIHSRHKNHHLRELLRYPQVLFYLLHEGDISKDQTGMGWILGL